MRFPYLPNFSYDFCMKTSTFDDPARYPKFQIHFPSLSTLRCWNGRPCVRVLGFFSARHRGEDDRNCQPSNDLHIQVREEVGKIRLRSVGCNILQRNSMLEYWAKFHPQSAPKLIVQLTHSPWEWAPTVAAAELSYQQPEETAAASSTVL